MNTLSPNMTVEHILTEDCVVEVEITEVLEVPVVEPILTADRITEVEIPHIVDAEIQEASVLEVPVVKLPRKRRNTQKVKTAKYSPMPGVHIKRIKNRLRLVYLSEV